MRLDLSEIKFDSGSVVDPAGVVFHFDSRVFRAIPAEYAPLYREFLQADFVQKVFDAGLIETWISDIEIEGFGLVVEHKKVPVLAWWPEFCSDMIKDATEMVCRLNLELSKHGYITKDTQPGNVQFVDGKPYWIDFGSIVRLNGKNSFRFEEFRYHSFLPLWLFSRGQYSLGKAMYQEVGKGFLKTLSTGQPFRWLPLKYALIKRRGQKGNAIEALRELDEYVQHLSIKHQAGFWTGYGQGGMPPVDQPDRFNEKAKAVLNLLKRLSPGTLLDLAGNKGWYAELAASMGHSVVSTDIDDSSVCYLYQRVKEKQLPILPLVLDFRFPTPPYGIGLGRGSAFERLHSNTTLTLALVHHLVFKEHMRFDTIIDIISQYSDKHAILEFVPKEDRYVREWYNPKFEWYSLDNLIKSLGRHFHTIEVFESWPEPRQLLFCSK